MRNFLFCLFMSCSTCMAYSQVSDANIYWVGHSLMDHTDTYSAGAVNSIVLVDQLATAAGLNCDYYNHITPGAPLGWNWGATAAAWGNVSSVIQPLLSAAHPDYGSYDVMVVTEGVNLQSSYDWWASSFYARQFFAAARAANANTRLYLYESWHHYNAGDFAGYYGPQTSFDWHAYMNSMRNVWNDIVDEAADPSMTQMQPNDHGYFGPSPNPGNSPDILDIYLVPTGEVLQAVLNRLAANQAGDNWSYAHAAVGGTLSDVDFFANPYINFPTDLSTTVHPGDPLDDIHASNVLSYLNALVHYAVIYQRDPAGLPALNNVPSNIASIFQEEVWDVVLDHPRTGVTSGPLPVEGLSFHANYQDNEVQLDWTSLQEQNNKGFEIEHTTDAVHWEKIGFVPAGSHPNQMQHYSFSTTAYQVGDNYYRLKQIDHDGSYSYSAKRQLIIDRADTLFVYPNPAQGDIQLSQMADDLHIYNSTGQLVLSQKNVQHFDSSRLAAGLYYFHVFVNGKSFRQSVVVE